MTNARDTSTTTYNQRRQLVREVSTRHLPGQSTGYDRAYGYDSAGNPTSWRGATRTFNSDNQETTGGNWTYDGNGNPTSHGGTTCTYDVGNHLTAFGSEFTAGYRGDGLRAWQQSGTTRKDYLYDGWRPVCELDSSGTVLRSWTFGADGLVAVGSEQALCDWQGNAAHWWDGSTWTLDAVLGGYGAAGSGYKWLHGYLDVSEDLILCTYRHLDPARGRWVTRDPIGYRGGVGLYGYVGSSPLSRYDAVGLRDWTTVGDYPPIGEGLQMYWAHAADRVYALGAAVMDCKRKHTTSPCLDKMSTFGSLAANLITNTAWARGIKAALLLTKWLLANDSPKIMACIEERMDQECRHQQADVAALWAAWEGRREDVWW